MTKLYLTDDDIKAILKGYEESWGNCLTIKRPKQTSDIREWTGISYAGVLAFAMANILKCSLSEKNNND